MAISLLEAYAKIIMRDERCDKNACASLREIVRTRKARERDAFARKGRREVARICERVRNRQRVLFPVGEHTNDRDSRVIQARIMSCVNVSK